MSLTSNEKTGTNEVTLGIHIDAKVFSDACDKQWNKQKKSITVPGFRKGHAPRQLVEKMYGEGVFYNDALEDCFPDVYDEALKESGIDAVDSPRDFDIGEISPENGVDLTCKVTVKPEIVIESYKGIEAPKAKVELTDEEVDAEIERRLEDDARMVDVDDRAVQDGDIVHLDYKGLKDGVAFDGGTAENQELRIGSGTFIPGFEEQLIGHNIGEEFDIDVTFPEDYHEESLKGAPVVFQIKINSITVKELPALDDEYAKDKDFDTFAEYKEDVRAKMLKDREDRAEADYKNALLDRIADSVDVEIPDVMIEREINNMLNDFDYNLRSQGMDLETYLKYTGMDEDTVRDIYRDNAEKRVIVDLVVEKVAELEGIEVTDEDLADEYKKVAEAYGIDEERVKKLVAEDTLREDIKARKAINIIAENGIPTEPEEPEEAEDDDADDAAETADAEADGADE